MAIDSYNSSLLLKYLGTGVVFLATFTLVNWIMSVIIPRKHLPPGPLPLPFLGNLHTFGKRIDETFSRFGTQYGNVFTVYFGSVPAVILNSYEVMRDAFARHGDAFTGRPNYIIFKLTANKRGIILSEGPVWKLHRKIILNLFRDFGLGKASFEHKICDEANALVEDISKTKSTPFHFHDHVTKAVANVISAVVYGERFQYEDPVFQSLIEVFDESAKLVGAGAIVNFFPWLQYVPGDLFNLKLFLKFDERVNDFNRTILERHLKNFNPNDIDNFIDSYIDALRKEGEQPDTSTESKMQMVRVIIDFFGAGSETTATTLRWAFLFLLHYPEFQTKIQLEIDEVIGRDGAPTMSHMRNMPFTEAFLCETQRIGNITPLGLFHMTTKDMHFQGYNIPANTLVLPNMTALMMNDKIYKKPKMFDPYRFLNEQGKVVKPESFIPFSIGKRVCIGESLARMELFMFTAILLQHFTFKLPDGHKLPSQEGKLGLTLAPEDFMVVAEQR